MNLPHKMNPSEDYDSYAIEEPSDEEGAGSSSEDEVDVLLHGTPEQKRKLLREYLTGESESSSEDEFEKEMEAELSSTIKSMECSWTAPGATATAAAGEPSGSAPQNPEGSASAGPATIPECYDDIYFDSDSEDDEKHGDLQGRKKKSRRVLTNDELLYDPDEDDRDQAWVDALRSGYRRQRKPQPGAAGKTPKSQPLPSSDAVLNCPACMTTLCMDCQRHEKYRTQYRAMFVMNCTVDKEEVLKYKVPSDAGRRNRRKKHKPSPEAAADGPQADPGETFHPVKCTECSTEVAVYDKDEVYHFFNILASYS
ncbi:E2F-associated phosphoprotein isoform X1 [Amia ocellicauda]|uniref:E2F-associated phosphoprotein isoform X1 n=1 Tax=Amia ocellicauda TaxID=2972642 RepID=UPI003464249C